jgi:hypothetical protein
VPHLLLAPPLLPRAFSLAFRDGRSSTPGHVALPSRAAPPGPRGSRDRPACELVSNRPHPAGIRNRAAWATRPCARGVFGTVRTAAFPSATGPAAGRRARRGPPSDAPRRGLGRRTPAGTRRHRTAPDLAGRLPTLRRSTGGDLRGEPPRAQRSARAGQGSMPGPDARAHAPPHAGSRRTARTSLPLPRYSRRSKLSARDMAIPRPWVSKARSGAKSR